MRPENAERLPDHWRVAVAIDHAARERGWYVRFRSVNEDVVTVVYRRGTVPEPDGRDDHA